MERTSVTPSSDAANSGNTSVAALLKRLRAHAGELLRTELALAKAEMVCAGHQLLRCALLGLLGSVLLLAGILALLTAIVIALSLWLPLWLAACAVGFVLLLAGVLTLLAARSKLDAESLA